MIIQNSQAYVANSEVQCKSHKKKSSSWKNMCFTKSYCLKPSCQGKKLQVSLKDFKMWQSESIELEEIQQVIYQSVYVWLIASIHYNICYLQEQIFSNFQTKYN